MVIYAAGRSPPFLGHPNQLRITLDKDFERTTIVRYFLVKKKYLERPEHKEYQGLAVAFLKKYREIL
ncbi:MAG: hypothetical protein WBB82_16900 [Limnothrix sp.]